MMKILPRRGHDTAHRAMESLALAAVAVLVARPVIDAILGTETGTGTGTATATATGTATATATETETETAMDRDGASTLREIGAIAGRRAISAVRDTVDRLVGL